MAEMNTEVSEPKDCIHLQPWRAFKAQNKLQPRYDWHKSKVPAELQIVPDEIVLPVKLKEILTWSLIQPLPSSPTRPQQKADDEVKDLIITQHGAEHAEAASERLPTESTISDNKYDLNSLGPLAAVGKPSGPHKRRLHAHHNSIGQGLFTSTLDLIITFNPTAEKDDRTQTSTKKAPQVECVSCFEEFPLSETPVLPCSHSYCRKCLKEVVLTALRNESSFPPKCCLTEIPLQTVLLSLDRKQRETYKDKAAEYAVPVEERWYCPNSKCLKWIPPRKASRFMSSAVRCGHCSTRICVTCRGLSHRRSQECPQDYGLEATLSLAEAEGWRRCFKCRAMVEVFTTNPNPLYPGLMFLQRTEGCRHMACRCGSQFCYYCGKKWKTCKCTDMEGMQHIAQRRHQTEMEEAIATMEAEEIARAIAEVEALEQREEEERLREAETLRRERFKEEERLKAEKLKEEEELRRLEQERLEEEERKRLEKEKEEIECRRVLRISVDEQIELLRTAFAELRQSQQHTLDSRHLLAEQTHAEACEVETTRQKQRSKDLVTKMEANIERRTASIGEKRQSILTAFEKESEQTEDDMFLQIQLHLQGKPNKDAREQRLRDELVKQRDQKLEAIDKRFVSEIAALNQNATMEIGILERTAESRLAEIKARYEHEFRDMLANVTTDRAWYDYLLERRQNMLLENSRLMLEAIDNHQEVVGLTEDIAMTIGPFAVSEPSPASSVTESPSRSFVELAEQSQTLLQSLAPGEVISAGNRGKRANQTEKNQAWEFMTLGSALASTGPVQRWTAGGSHPQLGLDCPSFPVTKAPAYQGDFTMSGALSPLDEQASTSPIHHSRRFNATPPVPPIPKIYLSGEAQQAADATSSVPLFQKSMPGEGVLSAQSGFSPSEHDDHKFIVIPSLHSRQSSSDSSGAITNSSSTSMTSFDSSSAASVQQRHSAGAAKQTARRMWSFRNLTGKGADKYTEEEIRERMKRTVGDAFGI
ncbi:hypothetical protein LTR84_007533 [Exophiala bonariae]|uniref:RBR-type E3 ubiquitin transferase n=1 Tax=Exophiala bonariae TaxID=1690606 RepID=A0AAV9NMT5_9EURO|nr:hypothetical protein LTR84_007533 [Exophiala bonariae]